MSGSSRERRTLLVTGALGSFGRVAVRWLAQDPRFEVYAVDVRDLDTRKGSGPSPIPDGVHYQKLDVRKRGFEDLVRKIHPEAIIHLAMVRRFGFDAAQRHRINFEGTAKVFEVGRRLNVKKMVFSSRATVYGALPDQPQFVTEEHPPSAGRTFPEMQDLVAADLYVSQMLWRYPDVETVLLRPVNVLGPSVSTLLNRYLGRRRVFTVLGFDPIQQVLHESDLGLAFERALQPGVRGVFNVAGPGQVPLHVLVQETGASGVALPESLIGALRGRLGFPEIPRGAIEYLKYPCTVDGIRFVAETGFAPRHDLVSTLRAVPRGPRAP